MKTRIAIILCAVGFMTQIIHSNGEKDPRLQSCLDKVIDQVEKVRQNKFPSCYDAEKLKQGKKDIAVFEELYNTLPPKCRKPTKEDIGECLKIIGENLRARSDDMQAGIINSIRSFILGGKQCYDNVKNVFANLDEYVLNGCQNDEL